MSEPVGITTDSFSAYDEPTELIPDWEAEILGLPADTHREANLRVRRHNGNKFPYKMYHDEPPIYETFGLVMARKARTNRVDARDVIIDGLHVTWRLLDQYLPGDQFIAIGRILMARRLPNRFVWFEGCVPTSVGMTEAIQAYIAQATTVGY